MDAFTHVWYHSQSPKDVHRKWRASDLGICSAQNAWLYKSIYIYIYISRETRSLSRQGCTPKHVHICPYIWVDRSFRNTFHFAFQHQCVPLLSGEEAVISPVSSPFCLREGASCADHGRSGRLIRSHGQLDVGLAADSVVSVP